jgi:hypothetical protein
MYKPSSLMLSLGNKKLDEYLPFTKILYVMVLRVEIMPPGHCQTWFMVLMCGTGCSGDC